MKAIAAQLKDDRVDSATLAHLSRCDLPPEAWMADDRTRQLRLQVRLRVTLGRERSRLKNLLQRVLHQEGQRKPVSHLLGRSGWQWLATLELSAAGWSGTYLPLIGIPAGDTPALTLHSYSTAMYTDMAPDDPSVAASPRAARQ